MRNVRIFYHSFLIKLREILAYRFEFIASFFGPILINTLILSLLWESILSYQNKTSIQGMTLQDFIIYYYAISVAKKIVVGAGVGYISRDIYYGELNKFLIYPINYQVFKWGSYFAPAFIYLIQIAGAFTLYQFFYDSQFNTLNFLTGFSLLVVSSFIYFLIVNLVEYMAFWHDNIWSLGVALRAFLEFCGGFFIPLSFFSPTLQSFLNFLPFPYILYYPIQIILGREIPFTVSDILLIYSFWIAFFSILNFIVWKKGNKYYTGVGI